MSNCRRVWLLQAPLALETELKKSRRVSVNQFSRSSLKLKIPTMPALNAIQALSARLDGMSNRVDAVEQGPSANASSSTVHGRNGAGASSLPSSGCFPNEPFGGNPGDDGEGENDEEEEEE